MHVGKSLNVNGLRETFVTPNPLIYLYAMPRRISLRPFHFTSRYPFEKLLFQDAFSEFRYLVMPGWLPQSRM